MARTALLAGLLALAAAGPAAATIVHVDDGSFQWRQDESTYGTLSGWADCPPGEAITALRLTQYGSGNSTTRHIRCLPVNGLQGPIHTKELNHQPYGYLYQYIADFHAPPGYNECPPGEFMVGVFVRVLDTTHKHVAVIKCQAVQSASTNALPVMVWLPNGSPSDGTPPPFGETAWSSCPSGMAGIGIGTEDYRTPLSTGGTTWFDQPDVTALVVGTYAVRVFGFVDALVHQTISLRVITRAPDGSVVDQTTQYTVPIVSDTFAWVRFIADLTRNGWVSPRAERWLTCVPRPGGCN